MYDKGRHDRHTAEHQASRYHLRGGIAKVALEAKVSGKPVEDCVGRPLKYANEMAERHGMPTIERWAKGWSAKAAPGKPSEVWCGRCKRRTGQAWRRAPHRCKP